MLHIDFRCTCIGIKDDASVLMRIIDGGSRLLGLRIQSLLLLGNGRSQRWSRQRLFDSWVIKLLILLEIWRQVLKWDHNLVSLLFATMSPRKSCVNLCMQIPLVLQHIYVFLLGYDRLIILIKNTQNLRHLFRTAINSDSLVQILILNSRKLESLVTVQTWQLFLF